MMDWTVLFVGFLAGLGKLLAQLFAGWFGAV